MRIIIDTQSNPLFQGSVLEQAYGLRGGLCEGGKDDIVVVANNFDKDYLKYWKGLGFDMPTILVTQNGCPELTLSQLIMRDNAVSKKLKAIASRNGCARLEFFCIEESERQLAEHLGIPAYCNFDFAFKFAKKPCFRRFCLQHNIPVVEGMCCKNLQEAEHFINGLHQRGISALVKSESGTGGIACGGAVKIDPGDNIKAKLEGIKFIGQEFVVEKTIESVREEISIHWEVQFDGQIRVVGIQDQLAKNFGYSGVSMPSSIDPGEMAHLKKILLGVLAPEMRNIGAIGFFSCDVILSPEEHWMDFNPRKGAAIYVRQMINRLQKKHFPDNQLFIWHEHNKVSDTISFEKVRKVLGSLIVPGHDSKRLIVITNSGVMPYGYLDITAISTVSREDARGHFEKAKNLILCQ
ncbi:MAG: hypothetical protein A2998_02045 [Candidatus Staskawiczbacteria bacterium RIFCSPLOWO2_01_FULL_37_25b]|uniref:ATP-grasp domain-containing protein n=1 Tax=Candidatus Staskawiczbacteria bacterium RIFCSPLOWO2_01_FULL_37_25b TaxID=1802213 RepID=A0A1G2IHW8_9BACT|nr:MAG: hypothetical protein A2998_02045 [Candidatus Staskawiczbacteria bacterium RIFCSPLOWO2_01_FULL_37_25b]